MHSSILQPTDDNVISTIKENLLDRNSYLAYFIKLIRALDGGSVVALDGRWGSGKTFFIKQCKKIFDVYSDEIQCVDADRTVLDNAIMPYFKGETFELSGYISVYYDSWRNDDDIDPVLSILYDIVNSVGGEDKLKKYEGIPSLLLSIIDAFAKTNTSGLLDKVREENILVEINNNRSKKQLINDFISKICEKDNKKLLIFIDEVDRCNPDFAVRILERIEDYYDNESIVFVYSVNMLELQHTIKMHYGNEFNASVYLNRFFDVVVELPLINIDKIINHYSRLDEDSSSVVHRVIINKFGFQCRDIIRYFDMLYYALHILSDTTFHNWYGESNPSYFCSHYLIPIMIGLKLSNISAYIDFIEGRNSDIFVEIMSDTEIMTYMTRSFLESEEIDDKTDQSDIYKERLQETYDALFNTTYNNNTNIKKIGHYAFDRRVIKDVFDTVGLLSRNSAETYSTTE